MDYAVYFEGTYFLVITWNSLYQAGAPKQVADGYYI